jgi:hypothetical protein
MGWRGAVKCPCLRQEVTPTCSADTEALRIPVHEHLERFCLTGEHRRCEIFRRSLGLRVVPRETWGTGTAGKPDAQRRLKG